MKAVHDRHGAALRKAVEAWRADPPEDRRLGPEARDRILQATLAPRADLAPLTPLFAPVRWVLGLGMATSLVLVAVAGWLVSRSPAHSPRVEASKHNGHLVLTIANGRNERLVYRSNVPDRFDPASAVRAEDGMFVDRLDQDERLVFYRID